MPFEFLVYKTHAAVNRWLDDGTPMPNILVIPDEHCGKPVTEIRPSCFARNNSIKHVVIPSTLKIIGAHAFEGCNNLVTVSPNPDSVNNTLPESLEAIEEKAFSDSGITGMLVILGKYLYIGDSAFEHCSGLTRIYINSEELTLGKGAFRSCYFLECVIGPTTVETLPEECFAFCHNLKIMALPFRTASSRCFYEGTCLDTIKPLQKLKSSGKDAFFGCNALVGIPEKWKGKKIMKEKASEGTASEAEENKVPVEEVARNKSTSKKPLFKLRIDCSDALPLQISRRIKGCFRTLFEKKFRITLPASMAAEEFGWEEGGELAGIIDYLANENIAVYLYGKYADGFYEVYDMEPDIKSGPLVSTAFFQELIRRTQESPIHKAAESKKNYYLRTLEEFQCFLATCKETLPPWAQEAAEKELFTLKKTPLLGDQRAHAQQALEILLNVDWNPPRNLYIPDLLEAQETLDKEFYGLHAAKEAFLDLITQMNRTAKLPEENLLLVGPPGVGKTYLINAMSRILKLPVVQLDFSGIGKANDEITGTSRVYSNARPGTYLQGCYDHRTSTVLLFLNEVDKASEKSASDTLLPLLDGAGVKEGFLEQVIPTKGRILCIASANDPSKLSPPLRSRFREITIDPYTSQEKLEIWRTHALPEAMENANVSPEELQFTTEAEEILVKEYGTEPGVRDIYSLARDFVRKYCHEAASDPSTKSHIFTPEEIKSTLGPSHQIHRPFNVHPGSVHFGYMYRGRAVLSMLEVAVEKGTGKLEILGAIPQVQKQYARIAWKAVKKTTSYDLSSTDVTVFFTTPILSDQPENIVGLPVYLALCSALIRTPLNLADTVIYGSGIDLFGNIYLDCAAPITPMIHIMEENHIRVIYGPTGLSTRVDFARCENSPIILESHEGEALVRMVMTNNQSFSG